MLNEEPYKALIAHLQTLSQELIAMRQASLKVTHKKDGSLLSNADQHAARTLRKHLSILFPDTIIVTEEDDIFAQSLESELDFWIVDPIDNTRDYVKGLDGFSILLSLVRFGKAYMSLVYYPVTGDVYIAASGKGAHTNDGPLSVSQVKDIAEAQIAEIYTPDLQLCTTNHITESTEAFVAVSKGQLDVAIIQLVGHHIWDLAFAGLLLEEAGGTLTTLDGHCPRFTELVPSYGWLLASNGLLHEAALHAVRTKVKRLANQ